MRNRTSALRAICCETITRLTLGTSRECRAACGCSSWVQVRRVVQHSIHTSKTETLSLNSFRATRHAPNAQRDVTRYERSSYGRGTSNKKGQQRERVVSEARTYSVGKVVKPSSVAVPLHGVVRSKQRKETPQRKKQHRFAGRFVSARSAYYGMSRPTSGTGKLRTLVPMSLSHRSTSPTLNPCISCTLGRWNAVSTCVGGVLNGAKQLLGTIISTQPLVLVLVPFVLVVVQPHTTKSLTGGVPSTSQAHLSCSSYIAGTQKGVL